MTGRRQRTHGHIVFFAEHEHDAKAIRTLLAALRPDLQRGQMKIRKSPPSLVKNLTEAKRRTRASKVVATLRAIEVKDGVHASVFHEDADDVEPAHVAGATTILDAYRGAPGTVVACVPAWELESWWFLFPEAVGDVSEGWRDPDQYRNKDTGQIANAKERLSRCVVPEGRGGRRPREYREEDCEAIAQHIADRGIVGRPRAKSKSWDHFVAQCREI